MRLIVLSSPFRVLHQKSKTSETHALTPRQRQQYSPPPEQKSYGGDYSPKYARQFVVSPFGIPLLERV